MGERIRIDDNWRFMRGDFASKEPVCGWGGAKARAFNFGAVSENLDDTKWRALDLPHDFVVEGDYTQIRLQETDMQKIPEMETMDSRHFAAGSLEGGVAWYRKHFLLPEEIVGKRVAIVFEGVYRSSDFYLNEMNTM